MAPSTDQKFNSPNLRTTTEKGFAIVSVGYIFTINISFVTTAVLFRVGNGIPNHFEAHNTFNTDNILSFRTWVAFSSHVATHTQRAATVRYDADAADDVTEQVDGELAELAGHEAEQHLVHGVGRRAAGLGGGH